MEQQNSENNSIIEKIKNYKMKRAEAAKIRYYKTKEEGTNKKIKPIELHEKKGRKKKIKIIDEQKRPQGRPKKIITEPETEQETKTRGRKMKEIENIDEIPKYLKFMMNNNV